MAFRLLRGSLESMVLQLQLALPRTRGALSRDGRRVVLHGRGDLFEGVDLLLHGAPEGLSQRALQ